MDYKKCSIQSTDSRVVVQENRSRFEVTNKDRISITKTQVDGCLIADHLEKCDWIISYEQPEKKALFVELKGCDVDKAISQLKSTMIQTKTKYQEYKKECYAVTTRIPKHGPSISMKKVQFKKTTGAILSVKNINAIVAA